MKNRQALAEYFAMLGFKVGVEVGVCRGYYSKTLCDAIPGIKMWGVDNWSTKASSHTERNVDDGAYKDALEVLGSYLDSGVYKIIRKSSMEALADFRDESLDFVYLDAGHTYEEVKEDINGWTPKVRKGGIVSGHDYYEFKSGKGGIIPAVNEYAKEHQIDLQVTDWDKENPNRDERQPSWYFIKS